MSENENENIDEIIEKEEVEKEEIDKKVKEKVIECEKFAESSDFPDKSVMYDAVYEQENYPFIKHK